MPKIYLSIDLDYWNERPFNYNFLDNVVDKCSNIVVVRQHHHLIPHVRKQNFNVLFNMDYHSDIADRISGRHKFSRLPPLNCGTWVNYINGIGKTYVWSYPFMHCEFNGTCHADYNPFEYRSSEAVCRWTNMMRGFREKPRLDNVVAVGISISRRWADNNIIKNFHNWYENRFNNKLQFNSIRDIVCIKE